MKWSMKFFLPLCVFTLMLACEAPGVKRGDLDTADEDNYQTDADAIPLDEQCLPPCIFPKSAINDPNSPLAERMVFFAYDKSDIKPEYEILLTNHGKYLASNPDVKVRLEGHTDERGSREYNLALGEQRAKTVRKVLLLHGAPADNVTTISFGEELPLDLGRDETAWAQNRRVELVYDAK